MALVLGLAPAAGAQTAPEAPGPREGDSLLRDLFGDLTPRLRDLLGDLSGYEAPEILPNGDILIRKKAAEPPPPQPVPGPDGEVEL